MIRPTPPATLIENDFTGAWAIPASGLGVGDYMQTLGYNRFMLNAKCDRDAQVFLQFSEDHATWYTFRDPATSEILQEHSNGTVGTAAATITALGQMHSTRVMNTHAINNILISFDGASWKTVDPGRSLSVPTNAYSFQIKGSAAATTYEILNHYYLYGNMVKANSNFIQKFYPDGLRYVRVLVQNLDSANALAANIDIKAMEAS